MCVVHSSRGGWEGQVFVSLYGWGRIGRCEHAFVKHNGLLHSDVSIYIIVSVFVHLSISVMDKN